MNDIPPLPKASRGGRVYSLENADNERLLTMVVALAAEVSVLHDKLDNVVQLAAAGSFSPADVESYRPDPAQAQVRAERRSAFVQRLLRVIMADSERDAAPAGMSYQDILTMVAAKE